MTGAQRFCGRGAGASPDPDLIIARPAVLFQATYDGSLLCTLNVDGKPGDMTGNGFHNAVGDKGVS